MPNEQTDSRFDWRCQIQSKQALRMSHVRNIIVTYRIRTDNGTALIYCTITGPITCVAWCIIFILSTDCVSQKSSTTARPLEFHWYNIVSLQSLYWNFESDRAPANPLYLICNQPSRCPNLSQMSYPTTTGGLLLSDQYLVEYRQRFISASISMMSPTIAQNNKREWYFRCFLHHSLLRRLWTNRSIKNRHRRYPKWNDLFFIMYYPRRRTNKTWCALVPSFRSTNHSSSFWLWCVCDLIQEGARGKRHWVESRLLVILSVTVTVPRP